MSWVTFVGQRKARVEERSGAVTPRGKRMEVTLVSGSGEMSQPSPTWISKTRFSSCYMGTNV